MDNRVSIINPVKALLKVSCPRCGDRYNKLVHYAKIQCKKCNLFYNLSEHNSESHVTFHFSYPLLQRVSHYNEVIVDAPTDHKFVLVEYQQMFKNMGCWDVTDITEGVRTGVKTTCNLCGFCHNCVACANCGTIYQFKKPSQRCSNCNSIKTKRVHLTEFVEEYTCRGCGGDMEIDDETGKYTCTKCSSHKIKVRRLCPHCRTDRITPTIVKNRDDCPLCGGSSLAPRKKIKVYEMRIKRLKAFMRDEDDIQGATDA